MKKNIIICVLTVMLLGLVIFSPAEGALKYFRAQHWITGEVHDAVGGSPSAEGRAVRIYFSSDPGSHAEGKIGVGGAAGQPNKYMINAFAIPSDLLTWEAGVTVEAGSPTGADTFGAGPVTVETTSAGFDAAGTMTLESLGVAPRIYDLRFDGMLYNPFPSAVNIVAAKPRMTATITVEETGSFINSVEVSGDGVVGYAGSNESWYLTNPATYEHQFVPDLAAGSRRINIRAWSSSGTFSDRQLNVTVAGGGTPKIVGKLAVYPQPFKPLAGENATIAYNLTANADITIYLYDVSGRVVWTRKFRAGQNGGRIGYNGVMWNGRTDFGSVGPNGIYVMKIISGKKQLMSGKLVVLD